MSAPPRKPPRPKRKCGPIVVTSNLSVPPVLLPIEREILLPVARELLERIYMNDDTGDDEEGDDGSKEED